MSAAASWAQVRDRVPDSAAIATKVRESSGIRRRKRRWQFRCKKPTFARGGLAAENRGVPGSSPGLAIRSDRKAAYYLNSLVAGVAVGFEAAPAGAVIDVGAVRIARPTGERVMLAMIRDPRDRGSLDRRRPEHGQHRPDRRPCLEAAVREQRQESGEPGGRRSRVGVTNTQPSEPDRPRRRPVAPRLR